MQYTPADLPSRGYLVPTKDTPGFTLKPFTFIEALNHTMSLSKTSEVKVLKKDIELLRSIDPNIMEQSLFDLHWIRYQHKLVSVTNPASQSLKLSLVCTACGDQRVHSLPATGFTFAKLTNQQEIKRVVLNGAPFRIQVPTIETFLQVLDKYAMYEKVTNVDIIMLISLFEEFLEIPNIVESAVLNATGKDIAKLAYLEQKLLHSVEPATLFCGNESCVNSKDRGMVVRVESLITDLFHSLLLNFESEINENEFK